MEKVLPTGVRLSDSFREQHPAVYTSDMKVWFVFEAYNHFSFVTKVGIYYPTFLFHNDRLGGSAWHFADYQTFTPENPRDWSLVNQWLNLTEPTPRSVQLPSSPEFGDDGVFSSLEEALNAATPWPGCPEWMCKTAVWQYRHNYRKCMPGRDEEWEEYFKSIPNHRTRVVHVRRK